MTEELELMDKWFEDKSNRTIEEFVEEETQRIEATKRNKEMMNEIHTNGVCPPHVHMCDGTYQPCEMSLVPVDYSPCGHPVYEYNVHGTTGYSYRQMPSIDELTQMKYKEIERINNLKLLEHSRTGWSGPK